MLHPSHELQIIQRPSFHMLAHLNVHTLARNNCWNMTLFKLLCFFAPQWIFKWSIIWASTWKIATSSSEVSMICIGEHLKNENLRKTLQYTSDIHLRKKKHQEAFSSLSCLLAMAFTIIFLSWRGAWVSPNPPLQMLRPKSNITLHKSQRNAVLLGQFAVITVGSPTLSALLITTTSCKAQRQWRKCEPKRTACQSQQNFLSMDSLQPSLPSFLFSLCFPKRLKCKYDQVFHLTNYYKQNVTLINAIRSIFWPKFKILKLK